MIHETIYALPYSVREFVLDSLVKYTACTWKEFSELMKEKKGSEIAVGAFMAKENRIYLHPLATRACLVHEMGHAIDWYLGDRKSECLSDRHFNLQKEFAELKSKRHYVSPYGLKDVREYFAEGFRAFLGANDNMLTHTNRAELKFHAPILELYFSKLFRI